MYNDVKLFMERFMKIALSTVLALFLIGCGDSQEAKHETKTEVKQEVVKPAVKKEVVVKKEQPKVEEVAQNVPAKTASVSGEVLFKKCAGCHGSKAEKKAMGKSAVINAFSSEKIADAIKGYKNGTLNSYGMGAVMKGQVSLLSDADIKALSEYIPTLK